MGLFLVTATSHALLPPFRMLEFLKQLHFIGNLSLFVIALTATFTGMVLALQGYYTLTRFGSEALLGPAVALSIIRELGPVLSGLMVTARAGSAMTSQLAVMRIKEQIDALETMGISPQHYLVVPRLEAAIVAMPLLTALCDVIGIYGGFMVAVQLLGMGSGTYFGGIQDHVMAKDIAIGFFKSLSFGVIIAWVSCYKGFYTGRGAEGVAHAITTSVVLSSVLILIWDYFVTSVML